MKPNPRSLAAVGLLGLLAVTSTNCANGPVTKANASHASRSQITSDSRKALAELYAKDPNALKLSKSAAGVLIFPNIIKGGLIVGAEGGNGALILRDQSVSKFYQTAGASYGLQAGVQKFGYALFLNDPSDIKNLDQAHGWEVGSSPSVVVLDRGKATAITTKTIQKGTYAYFFNQEGLMAGLGLKGSKITRIYPGP